MKKSQLQKLEQQREALNKKIAEEKRKVSGRRKYLIGEAFDKAVADGKISIEIVQKYAEHYIKNKHDREILGLPELVEANQDENQ